jgi:hypothetical protein
MAPQCSATWKRIAGAENNFPSASRCQLASRWENVMTSQTLIITIMSKLISFWLWNEVRRNSVTSSPPDV